MQSKSMSWFPYDRDLRHERVKKGLTNSLGIITQPQKDLDFKSNLYLFSDQVRSLSRNSLNVLYEQRILNFRSV